MAKCPGHAGANATAVPDAVGQQAAAQLSGYSRERISHRSGNAGRNKVERR